MNVTTLQDLKSWFARGVATGNTHMIVVCDTFDYSDFPVYVNGDANVARHREQELANEGMNKIMEVYDLRQPMDFQMAQRRCFEYGA